MPAQPEEQKPFILDGSKIELSITKAIPDSEIPTYDALSLKITAKPAVEREDKDVEAAERGRLEAAKVRNEALVECIKQALHAEGFRIHTNFSFDDAVQTVNFVPFKEGIAISPIQIEPVVTKIFGLINDEVAAQTGPIEAAQFKKLVRKVQSTLPRVNRYAESLKPKEQYLTEKQVRGPIGVLLVDDDVLQGDAKNITAAIMKAIETAAGAGSAEQFLPVPFDSDDLKKAIMAGLEAADVAEILRKPLANSMSKRIGELRPIILKAPEAKGM